MPSSQRCARSSGRSVTRGVTGKDFTRRDSRPRRGSGRAPVAVSASVSCVSTSDRSGLLYSIARVLARHHINLQLAKITTLGERVEDTFLIDGAALQQNKLQIQVESELLDAISA